MAQILILGAGQVGTAIASALCDDNDITIVDIDNQKLAELHNRLDIQTVQGFASYPSVLYKAGIDSADMLIAVTQSDETNIVTCMVARKLFKTPMLIARIRSSPYHQTTLPLFTPEAIDIDHIISPEALVTKYMVRLIENPGCLQVLSFAQDTLRLVAFKAHLGSVLIGKTLNELRKQFPDVPGRFTALFRNGHAIELTDDTHIQMLDEIFLMVPKKKSTQILNTLGQTHTTAKRVIIAGGGNIGFRLAKVLENKYNVKLIERNEARAQHLSEELSTTTILLGESTDPALLLEENIEYADFFIAATDNDEVNIMSCLQAKRLKAKMVMAIVTRANYVKLLESGSDIDVLISPQLLTAGFILRLLRRVDMPNVFTLYQGTSEVIEVLAHDTSYVIGKTIDKINKKLPGASFVVAVSRNEEPIFVADDFVIEKEDHLILFIVDKTQVKKIERLFSVNAYYV